MAESTSPATGRRYGIERECRAWQMPRSTYYAQNRRSAEQSAEPPRCRGPRPKISDEQLLAAIRKDLHRSPFRGEGHRKVWARLRVLDDIRVGRKRVLRVMRDNQLLSPHRGRRAQPRAHDGKISTDAPNIMWGTDGARILTADDGYVWLFVAVEHWNAECVGWHVCKHGTRYAALEPISQGVKTHFGSLENDAARGMSLRMDHGTQYLADHFINQVKFWGIQPSYAFVAQPQTNGVAERFIRTVKEQAIHGRIFKNIDEVRRAVEEFINRYNKEWLIEKLGFISPTHARENCGLPLAA